MCEELFLRIDIVYQKRIERHIERHIEKTYNTVLKMGRVYG